MHKRKVLIIQEYLMSYRDPIFALINKKVDLTVAYTIDSDITKSVYPIICLPYIRIWKVIWHKKLMSLINQFDVVVLVPHFRMIRLATLPLIPHKPKIVTWSIGVHASRTRHYDLTRKPDIEDWLYENIQDCADACIFYMPGPIEYWRKFKKIDSKKYFVAHNTVAIAPYEKRTEKRDIILFVGTLYKQKGIDELINCYEKAKAKVDRIPHLKIIGGGPERHIIETLIKNKHLEDDVELIGPIYDENILKEYFLKSIICISPKQAGLTVLKSFGYGVPFVTRFDAITGGEKDNIINGKNGFLYTSSEELVGILIKTATSPKAFSLMSDFARDYYFTNASPEIMAKGILDAIDYSLSKRK